MIFLGPRKLGNICCGQKMFLNKIRNIFCVRDTKFVSATNVARAGKRETFVSATMCPHQCVLVCQGLKRMTKTKKSYECIVFHRFYYLQRHWNLCLLFQVQLRGEILKRLRELKDLKDADVLGSTQFEAQKRLLLSEWASLKTLIFGGSFKLAVALAYTL